MDDTVFFISAYYSTQYKALNWISRKIRQSFSLSKNIKMQSLLKKYHLSFVATDEVFISPDGKAKIEARYDYVHQETVFSFNPQNGTNNDSNNMPFVKHSGFYLNLRHAQSVLLDDRYFKIKVIFWLSPFLVWINNQTYQVDAGAFMMNDVWFVVFEVIDYKTGKSLTKDDVGCKTKNYNLLLTEKYQFFDGKQPINAGMKIPEIIYEIVSGFTWELTNKCFYPEEYSFVHDTVVLSNSIENISDYLCKLIGTKTPASIIKDISTVEIYEYYPQDGCSVISNYDCNQFNAVLYPAIILEAVKLYIYVFQISNLEEENEIHKLVRNDLYVQNLFYSPNLPIETHNLLNYVKESEAYKKHFQAFHLKISYLSTQNDLKKNRNATILNILLYIISLLGAIGTLDVIEAHFGVPFKYGFIAVVVFFALGLIWWIIEYRNNRRL